MFTMASVRSNGKRIRRLTQAEVVNYSGRELPEVSPTHLRIASVCEVMVSLYDY